MASAEAHSRFLKELRAHSSGPPENLPKENFDSDIFDRKGFLRRLDLLVPLLRAAGRTSLVRSVFAAFLGTFGLGWTLARRLSAGPVVLDGSSPWEYLGPLVYLLLLVCGTLGVPGAVPWLEVRTKAGFYCSHTPESTSRNARIQRAFQGWLSGFSPCPYLRSGELCTVLPYFWNPNRGRHLAYERVWLHTSDDERFAVDWIFPPSGHNPERPVVVILTGLAPSEHWTKTGGFIADAAWHLTTHGDMTVAVLVARGSMDTEVKEHMFHGARVCDLRQVVLMTEEVLCAVQGATAPSIFAAGFSMGGIILANYCGKFGSDARLRGAIHFSGIHDAVASLGFHYSTETWQAYLAYNLKNSFLTDRMLQVGAKRGVNVRRVLSRHVASVVDLDRDFIAVFNGYKDLEHYYSDLSVASDDKWRHVGVPLLAVAARDDPITHCDTLRAEEFSGGNSNLLFLITDNGGHVGWPWGLTPWTRGWDFQNQAIGVFVEAVLADQ